MAQQGNPFRVDPVNIMPGLSALAGAFKGRGERELEKTKERKAQRAREVGFKIAQTGSPTEIAEFMVKHPEAAQAIRGAVGFQSEETERRLLDTVRNIYTGQADPFEASAEHAEFLINEDADPSHTMGLVEESAKSPEMGKEEAGRIWASLDPKGFAASQKALGVGGQDKTQDVKNYEYAQAQGFKGSLLDYQTAGKDKDNRTTAIKEFEYGEKNPKFALRQKSKDDAEITKANKQKTFKSEMDLRKEFLSQSSDFQKVRDAYTRVVGSTQEPSPAGDLSLIFNYMKMLDPGSVVRESEFATAASSGSYGERMQASVQKVLSGERLSPNMRADFLKKSGVLMKGMQDQHKKREKSYGEIADRNNLSREGVIVDLSVPVEQSQEPAAPKYKEGQAANGEGQAEEITTQQEYDQLPSGATFFEDGVKYRKP